jgi:predicted RNA binding protein YcfA (HicA-like mRNA interferase family)
VKLPRDISGSKLAQALRRLGYELDHQTGSHMRLTTRQAGEHHVTIPAHDPLKIGTLNAVLNSVGQHFGLSREEVLRRLLE